MAEAQAKKNNKDIPAEGAAAISAAAKKTDVLGLAILALVGVNVLALGGMGYFMQKLWVRMHEVQAMAAKKAVPAASTDEPSNSVGKELQPQNLGVLYSLDGFLVNVNSDQGSKFLQVQFELELSDPALEDEVSRKKAAIRDAVIVLLTSRSYKELKAANGLVVLRADIMQAINHLLSSGKVKDVYFTQYHFN